MSNVTHYENFVGRFTKHRVAAKKAVEFLRKRDESLGSPDTSDKWIENMIRFDASIELPNGKEHSFIPSRMPNDFIPFLDAFVMELHDYWFSKFEPDREKPLSFKSSRLLEPMVSRQMRTKRWDRTTTMLQYQLLSHERAGRRVYEVSEGLSAKLQHTELRGLTCEDLRLPFSSVYIAVPHSAGFKVYNHVTGWHPVVGVYITEDKRAMELEPGGEILTKINTSTKKFEITCLNKEGEVQSEFKKSREWSVMIVGGPKDGADSTDDALYWFDLTLVDEHSLDESVASAISSYNDDKLEENFPESIVRCFREMSDVWTVIFRWCINVIVYATYTEPGELAYNDPIARQLWKKIEKMPASRKRTNLIDRFKSLGVQERRYLGKQVIVVDRERQLMEQGGTGRAGAALTVRTLVCGHWRKVPYGPGRQYRRATFIEPFWRGPDDGTKQAKTHVLK